MARGSRYAQRQAYKYGLDVIVDAISDGASSDNATGTIEVSQTSGSAFVVDSSDNSEEMKNWGKDD